MLVNEYKDGTTFWRIPCSCMCKDHDADLWFEVDQHAYELQMSYEVGFYPKNLGWWKALTRRVSAATQILFKGHYTMQGEVMLDDAGVEGLKYALNEGQKHARSQIKHTPLEETSPVLGSVVS